LISEDVTWRKSSYSGGSGGNCVEVGNAGAVIVVRDSKDRDGAVVAVGADAWRRFAAMVRESGRA
jgi:Domain of unknown function (DUF397)